MQNRISAIAILLIALCLPAVFAQGQDSKVESGQINGANFRIEVPANWGSGKVMELDISDKDDTNHRYLS